MLCAPSIEGCAQVGSARPKAASVFVFVLGEPTGYKRAVRVFVAREPR